MNAKAVLVTVVFVAATSAGCDRKEADKNPNVGGPPKLSSETPTSKDIATPTPVMMQAPAQSPPTAVERKDGSPVQGQVDARQPEQRRDFETKKR